MIQRVNRVVVILLLLVLVACSALSTIGLLIPPLGRPFRARWLATVEALVALPDALAPSQRVVLVLGMVALGLLAFMLLAFELRGPNRDDTVRVKGGDGNQTVITRRAIVQRVQYAVDRLDDVVQVTPTVSGGADGLTVHLHVTTRPQVDIALKAEEIRAVTREVIERQMGLVLRRAVVKLDHEAYRDIADVRRI